MLSLVAAKRRGSPLSPKGPRGAGGHARNAGSPAGAISPK